MANPLPHEHEIYEKIKQENITMHPLIWELLEHHINNDTHMINMIIGATVMDNEPMTKEDAQKIINHTQAIADYLDKIERLTKPKSGDV